MKEKCGYRDDGTLASCPAMKEYAENAPSHKKGLSYVVVIDTKTLVSSVYGIVYKRTAQDPGIMLNYCPWCGGDIKHPSQA